MVRAGAGPETTRGGEAVRSSDTVRPAQRHEAQPARLTTSADGPMLDNWASGRSPTPGVGATPTSVTQPRSRRPPRLMRTIEPTRSRSALPSAFQASGTA